MTTSESAKQDWQKRFDDEFPAPENQLEAIGRELLIRFIDRELKAARLEGKKEGEAQKVTLGMTKDFLKNFQQNARLEGLQAARRLLMDTCWFNDDKNLNEPLYRKGINDASVIAVSAINSLIKSL